MRDNAGRGSGTDQSERGNTSIIAAVVIALLLALSLFGTKLGLPSDLVVLYRKLGGIRIKADAWKPYISADGGYLVDMPGVPALDAKPSADDPNRMERSASVLAPDKYLFSVTHTDCRALLPPGSDPDALLTAVRDGAVRGTKGRLMSDKPVRLDRFPGLEFFIEEEAGIARVRLVLRDTDLYVVALRSNRNFALSGDADRFFGSFRFIGGAAAGAPVAPGWKEFSPIDGHFSVQMPGLPRSEQQTFRTRDGEMVLYLFNLDHGRQNERYSVQYTDYPDQFLKQGRSADEVLQKAGTVDAFNVGGTVVTERPLPLGRHAGREVQVESAEMTMRIRLYLVDKRLFKVIATRPKGRAFSPDDEQFLASFRLTE